MSNAAPSDEQTNHNTLKLAVVTPARNEAAFLEKTIRAVIAQTLCPVRWVIVSDGSIDGTDEIIQKYAAEYDWIHYLRMPERRERHFGGKAKAVKAAYETLQTLDFDLIANLDADITIEPEHFEFFANRFAEIPRLGCAGPPFREGTNQYDYRFTSIEHVSGACQIFRRACFEEIGGYQPAEMGVDHIAVMTARMRGWKTRTFPEMVCRHHRKMGSAERGPVEIAFQGGIADYRLGAHPFWQLMRTPYQMTKSPVIIGGTVRLAGFVWAAVTARKKVVSRDLQKFRRTEQMSRLRNFVTSMLSGSISSKAGHNRTA
jgi:glycosyltransferase involved in cell wall biosynthesis